MAFQFVCSSTKKSFIIALKDVRSVESTFAEGYSKAKFASFASSDDNFHNSFFADKPSSHALIVDVVINGRLHFKIEDLEVITGAVANLEEHEMSEHPVYGLLLNAKQQVEAGEECVYDIQVVSTYSEE